MADFVIVSPTTFVLVSPHSSFLLIHKSVSSQCVIGIIGDGVRGLVIQCVLLGHLARRRANKNKVEKIRLRDFDTAASVAIGIVREIFV